jgi:hypothetical protein
VRIEHIRMNIYPQCYFHTKTAYKGATWYMPYQSMYGLHPLMPIVYIMLINGGNEKNNTLVRILISKTT